MHRNEDVMDGFSLTIAAPAEINSSDRDPFLMPNLALPFNLGKGHCTGFFRFD